jgi:hypothetical protein
MALARRQSHKYLENVFVVFRMGKEEEKVILASGCRVTLTC